MPDYSYPEEVTRQSGSNLALAFVLLPPERRRDITVFYAFCRVIDDLVDATERSPEEKRAGLDQWRALLFGNAPLGAGREASLAGAMRHVMEKYAIPREYFEELIAGVEMDLAPARYATWEELRHYCYRVASVVGLVSIEIFGYRNPASREYAISLGYALQLTNILRDVARDARNEGRIYLPLDDLARHGVTEQGILNEAPEPGFSALMHQQAARAHGLYAEARGLLPAEDRRSMLAAELMGAVYSKLLRVMESDGFQVFQRDYRLGKVTKLAIIAKMFLRGLVT
jgi:phytoene synthase